MVLSEDMAIYKLRERVSGSLAPTRSWVFRSEQAGCSSPLDKDSWISIHSVSVRVYPYFISKNFFENPYQTLVASCYNNLYLSDQSRVSERVVTDGQVVQCNVLSVVLVEYCCFAALAVKSSENLKDCISNRCKQLLLQEPREIVLQSLLPPGLKSQSHFRGSLHE